MCPHHFMADVVFVVSIISNEFPGLLIDKGSQIHSPFIMESSDISSLVGYQDTWSETWPSN